MIVDRTSRKNTHGLGKNTPLQHRSEYYRWDDLVRYIVKYGSTSSINILDIGCGDGLLAKYIHDVNSVLDAPLNIKYFGLDNYSGYKNSEYLKSSSFILGDLSKLDKLFPRNKFDVVVASEVIEHIDKTDDLVINIKKILKPKGILYLTTPNLSCWHSRLLLALGYLPLPMEVSNLRGGFGKGILNHFYSGEYELDTVHHIRCFTLGALRDFIKFHKYTIIQLHGGAYNPLMNTIFRFIPGLSPVLKLVCVNDK